MIGADRVYTAHLLATMFLPIAHFNVALLMESGVSVSKGNLRPVTNICHLQRQDFRTNLSIEPAADFLAQTSRKSADEILRQVSVETKSGNKSSAISAADINAIFGSQYGKTIDITTLQSSIDQLKTLYEDRGYELVEIVDTQELTATGKLVVVVTEGVIEDIRVRFLDRDRKSVDAQGKPIRGKTRDSIITREIELKTGNIYNNKSIERDLRRLYKLGLFEDLKVSFEPGKTDPSHTIVQIDVIELPTVSGLTLRDRFGSNVELSQAIGYQLRNFDGKNQTLTGDVVVSDGTNIGYKGFNLSYNEPWIAGDPHRTSYEFNLFSRQSRSLIFSGGKTPTFVPNSTGDPRISRTGGEIIFSRSIDGNPYRENGWRGSLSLGYQKVSIQTADGKIIPQDSANQPLSFSKTGQDDLLTAKIGLSRDTRDRPFQPTQGALLKFGAEQSIPIGESKITLTKLTGSYSHYLPVSILNFVGGASPPENRGAQTLAFNLQGGTALGDLPPYEAFALGGVSSVRGYEEAELGAGRSYLRASTEYQFPIFAILGGAIFADYGTDLGTGKTIRGDPAGIRGKPGSGFGYGVGLRIGLPAGTLQVNYGINDRGEQRIQFGLSDR
jgi:outer membrane protein insertion porin family